MSKEGFFRRWSRMKAHPEIPLHEDDTATANRRSRAGENPIAPATTATARLGAVVQDAAVLAGASMQRAGGSQVLEFEPVAQTAPHPPVTPAPVPESQARPLPTLDDVALLGPDSDFSAFMVQGVDKKVRALAMKKLFTDPHFNVMDGLDTYIDDYNRADPLQAALLASLQHAKSIFGRFTDDDQASGRPGSGVPPKDQEGDIEPPQQNDA
jgi:hypothetical protein